MATKFKDFGSTKIENLDEIKFKLYNEEFTCYRAIQGKILLEVAGGFDGENTANANDVIEKFFKSVLEPESYERFNALIHDPERIVPVEDLGEITGWLVEQYSERPTQGSSDS